MILVDANLLLYAVNASSPFHIAAREWWEAQLSGDSPVGLSWTTILAFIRIGTNKELTPQALSQKDALERVNDWLVQPCVRILEPTVLHWEVLQKMLRAGGANPKLTGDAHLAALAVEHDCEICTADRDFAKFPGVQWKNPLVQPKASHS